MADRIEDKQLNRGYTLIYSVNNVTQQLLSMLAMHLGGLRRLCHWLGFKAFGEAKAGEGREQRNIEGEHEVNHAMLCVHGVHVEHGKIDSTINVVPCLGFF